MTEVWGLTGGIATGKSTVSAWLRAAGIPVIDADIIARQVVAPKTQGLQQIAQTFGADFVTEAGLDRKKLGQWVFTQPAELKKLEAITAPLIQAQIRRELAAAKAQQVPVVMIDAPTFFEVGYLIHLVDHVMVVATDVPTQKQRLMARDGLSAADAQARMDRQWPLAKKIAQATVVIDNGGTIAQTRQQVVKWLDANKFGNSNHLKRGEQ
ncbi:MAG: dephospho-CoA kinase [Levilactobacillus sp.]|jgi:dephospho-CoA kinase|uniref:dephospho-CoA kinase n=1 Tax=Levilactobacillus sp. TaxID=2767919 RepID=UPI0025847694|nr:dephospho-CoA kinase [Levilactobacillus sp.]MCH4123522.1 dephospho-CoA kinase [Levilactobacillus sp.]MCI1552340.1 dephospho-CoA kinase [Levilactobacillus sp.]MCI1598700.1 dephospho-CoA kinase [Levilactobacillus sp.]MCI1606020.1 dephospho-CoA kinase [Levilactobacillus sp.]